MLQLIILTVGLVSFFGLMAWSWLLPEPEYRTAERLFLAGLGVLFVTALGLLWSPPTHPHGSTTHPGCTADEAKSAN
jgi:hypothetical protein